MDDNIVFDEFKAACPLSVVLRLQLHITTTLSAFPRTA